MSRNGKNDKVELVARCRQNDGSVLNPQILSYGLALRPTPTKKYNQKWMYCASRARDVDNRDSKDTW